MADEKKKVNEGKDTKKPVAKKEDVKKATSKKGTEKKVAAKKPAVKKENLEKTVSKKEKTDSKKVDDKKKKVEKTKAKKTNKKKAPKPKMEKIAKPVPPKKKKEMTPKEKRDFEREMKEYDEKVDAAKAAYKAQKQKIKEEKSKAFQKTGFGKFVNKIKPKPKPKAPKLEDPKLAREEAKRKSIEKRLNRRTKAIRRRAIGVVLMCVCVLAVFLGGFKIAGALELNAGYAAKTGDLYFKESEVTKYITEQTYFKSYSKSLSNWSQYLSMYGLTGEKFRQQVIEDHFAHDELVRQAAEAEGVTVDEAEVDKACETFKSKYSSDANYKKALEDAGYTEETYRDHAYQTMLEKNLIAKVITKDAPSDDDVKTYLSSYSSTYKDARRSSHILFDSKDQDKAQQVLDDINSGKITFEAAVAQYSIDTDTKAKGGDRGWDKIESFSSAYNSGLTGLSAGEVNKTLVTDKEGIHIVKCTEKWDTPEKIESLDGVPQAIIEQCRKKKDESNKETELKTWLETFASDHGIETKIFPMPSGLPYDVDMSKSTSSASSSAASSSSSSTTTSEE